MSKRLLLVLGLAGLLMLGTLASPAAAAKKRPFCDVVADLSDVDGDVSGTNANDARRIANAFDNGAKRVKAPKKVVKAMTTIADFYDDVAGADSKTEQAAVIVRNGAKYGKAIATYGAYYTSECVMAALATTTTTRSSSTTTTGGGGSTTTTGGGSSGSSSSGTIAGTINGRPLTATASTCNASGGSVRTGDGSFQLTWSGNTGQLTWSSQGNTYAGSVQVGVIGSIVTFAGTASGTVVAGTVTCT